MKILVSHRNGPTCCHTVPPPQLGGAVLPLIVIAFVLGLAAASAWFYLSNRKPAPPAAVAASPLPPAVLSLLENLKEPVNIHFFSVVGEQPDVLRAFASRVDDLLTACEENARGKLSVTRYGSGAPELSAKATAAGVKPFGLDKEDPSYLGLKITSGDQHETMSQLQPEWESALPVDLARAIQRVTTRNTAMPVAEIRPETIKRVQELLPDYQLKTLDEGSVSLRLKALESFSAITREMQARIEAAEAKIVDAQNRNSEAERLDAFNELQKLQSESTARLKEVSSALDAQIKALEHLKKQ